MVLAGDVRQRTAPVLCLTRRGYLFMKKNDEFEIDITDIGTEGEGIGKMRGLPDTEHIL